MAKWIAKDQVERKESEGIENECIKASLDFSKEIIMINTCKDYIKFFLERI